MPVGSTFVSLEIGKDSSTFSSAVSGSKLDFAFAGKLAGVVDLFGDRECDGASYTHSDRLSGRELRNQPAVLGGEHFRGLSCALYLSSRCVYFSW